MIVFVSSERPKAVVIQKPNWPLVFRGENISLTCDIQGQPPDGHWRYSWYRDKYPLGSASEKNDISLGKVDKSFNGLYKCVVSVGNQSHHLESEPYEMRVLGESPVYECSSLSALIPPSEPSML